MEQLYSHYSTDNKKELRVHLENVALESRKKILDKSLELTIISQDELAKLAYLIGVAHDFGKATTYFQNYLVHGEEHKFSHHGLISAFFGYLLVDEYLGEQLFSIVAYLVIKRHHGNLDSPLEESGVFWDTRDQLQNIENENKKKVKETYSYLLAKYDLECEDILTKLSELVNKEFDQLLDQFRNIVWLDSFESEEKSIELFLVTNLTYSVLIDSDKKDAAQVDNSYFNGALKSNVDVNEYIEQCRKENPDKFDPTKPINQARNEFLSEVVTNPELKQDNYLYSLTAPTGIGKTFASFAFANQIKDLYSYGKRIIYCLPYTSIIDQNYEVLEEIIDFDLGNSYRNAPTKHLIRHHYLTPLRLKEGVDLKEDSTETKNLDKYLDEKLLLESWESGTIVTTFVQLLESIIGNKNSYLKKFHNIVNSVIILDEVQNIPVEYYKIAGQVLEVLGKKFNTHILLLTATQPELVSGDEVVKLVDEDKYAQKNVFNRVELGLVDNLVAKTIEEFIEFFRTDFNSNSGLVVCNTISSALEVFEAINDIFPGYKIFSLTTYLVPKDREKRIKEIEELISCGEKVIVVSTQLIEAGVDLSFGQVYRDFGPLDSIIQVAGRCNRNGELGLKQGTVKIVKLSDEKRKEYSQRVYDAKLLQICEEVITEQDCYESNDFIDLSRDYFAKVRATYERESNQLLNAIAELNYSLKMDDQIPIKDFELIDYQAGKEDIIICKTLENEEGELIDVQDQIERLKLLYEEIKTVGDDQEKLNILIGKIELIKKKLAEYRISVYSNQLEKYYKDYQIIEDFRFLKYIRNEDLEYIYDEETGFLKEPTEDAQHTEMF